VLLKVPTGTRKNCSEIYRQFGHAPTKRLGSPAVDCRLDCRPRNKFYVTEASCSVAVFRWGYSCRHFEVYFFVDHLALKVKALPSIQMSGTSKPDTEDLNLHGFRYEIFIFRKADIGKRILINIDTSYKSGPG